MCLPTPRSSAMTTRRRRTSWNWVTDQQDGCSQKVLAKPNKEKKTKKTKRKNATMMAANTQPFFGGLRGIWRLWCWQ